MNWYTLVRMDNGEGFDQIQASDAGWAALMYVKSIGELYLTADVAVVRDGMIHAIISERGGRKPDIMVIAQMRAKLTTGEYTHRPAGVTRQPATAVA